MDFPAFDKNSTVKKLNQTSQSNEFCLCNIGFNRESEDSDFGYQNQDRRNNGDSRAPPPMYNANGTTGSDPLGTFGSLCSVSDDVSDASSVFGKLVS